MLNDIMTLKSGL